MKRVLALVLVLVAVAAATMACSFGDEGSIAPTEVGMETRDTGVTTIPAARCVSPLADYDREEEILRILAEDLAGAGKATVEYVAIRQPAAGVAYASGISTAGTVLDPRAPFRIASNTKTFTAAAILRLYEQGNLDLDAPISQHISPEAAAVLTAGGYDPEAITIRQMLHHVSGLFDYASSPGFDAAVIADPMKHWTRLEQVQFAVDHGGPVGEPGERFAYSDTGYILLGEILERTTGVPLAAAFRTLLRFDELGLRDTYLESLEPVPAGTPDRVQQLFGEIDATSLDPSYDLYGGGGLVSTVDDLSRFYCGLFSGGVFDDPRTMDIMISEPEVADAASTGGMVVGMGLFALEIGGRRCWGHSGFWGSSVVHCQDTGVTIARTINEALLPETYDLNRLNEQLVAALQ